MTITRHSRSFLFAIVQCCCFLGGSALAQTSDQSNYNNCLYGAFGCDKSRLTQKEREEVAAAEYHRNYNSCLYGAFGCDKSRLTQKEREEVAAAEYHRNYNSCLYGAFGCDKSRLTQKEREEVAAAEYHRNYNSCLYGAYGCDKSRLTQKEREEVAAAEYHRNYNSCLYGAYGCDRSKLNPSPQPIVNALQPESRSEPQSGPELRPLDYFVGGWNITGQIVSTSFGVRGKYTGQYRNHWSADGLSLISDWNEHRPASTESGQITYEYDPELKAYVCHSVDSSGEKETSVGNVEGQTWTWLSSHTTADGNLGGRFTIKQESEVRYTFTFESQSAGGEWELAMEGSASKKP